MEIKTKNKKNRNIWVIKMAYNYNILTDELGMENYLALCIAIVGYKDKETGEQIFPTAKESLEMMNIPTNDRKEGDENESRTDK